MSEFDNICESYGIMKKVVRERYPREIRLSEEFLEALKKEFYNHKLEEDAEKPIRNYPEKFAKALRFELSHLNDRADIELETMRQKFTEEAVDVPTKHQIKIAKDTLKLSDAGAKIMGGMTKDEARAVLKKHNIKFEESNDERVPEVTVDGEKEELPQNDAPKNTEPKNKTNKHNNVNTEQNTDKTKDNANRTYVLREHKHFNTTQYDQTRTGKSYKRRLTSTISLICTMI